MTGRTEGDGDRGTVTRVLRMLTYIAQQKSDFGIKEIADALVLPHSTAHRLLHLLAEDGFVERGPSRRYRAGSEMLRVARVALEGSDIVAAAMAPMRRVVDACGETCLLGLYRAHNHTMSFVARVDSAKPLRYRVRMHGEETLAWGASGRSILAFLPPEVIAAVAARAEASPSSGARLALPALRADLDAIRRAGYARSDGQRIEGAAAIGVPIRAASDRVAGSLCVSVPQIRFRASDEAMIAATLMRESAEISRLWGHDANGTGTSGGRDVPA